MKKEIRVLLSIPAYSVALKAAPEWGLGDSQKVVSSLLQAVDSQAPHKSASSRGRCGVAEGWQRSQREGRDAVQLPPSDLAGRGSSQGCPVLAIV